MMKHGTATAYQNDGCRCGECREAQRVYRLGWLPKWKLSNGLCTTDGCNRLIIRKRDGLCTVCVYHFDRYGTVVRQRAEPDRLVCGTTSKYCAGCRCPECTEAERVFRADYRASRAEQAARLATKEA